MNDRLLGMLRKVESIHRERYEAAEAANQAVHENNVARLSVNPLAKLDDYPFSQDEMKDLELDMLGAQIELEREESKPQPMYAFTPKGDADGMSLFGIVPLEDAHELPTIPFASPITPNQRG
jgi:hypothetical protein